LDARRLGQLVYGDDQRHDGDPDHERGQRDPDDQRFDRADLRRLGQHDERRHAFLSIRRWNRLTKVTQMVGESEQTVAEYEYDGLNRRVIKKTYTNGTLSETRHSTERSGSGRGRTPGHLDGRRQQYVWGVRYVDDLVLRDRDTDSNGTLDERLYAMQDANWNVTAIADASGAVVERYTYTAYGEVESPRQRHLCEKTKQSFDLRLDGSLHRPHDGHRDGSLLLSRPVLRCRIGGCSSAGISRLSDGKQPLQVLRTTR